MKNQETLEEVAEKYAKYQQKGISDKTSKFECINDFIAGANWQAERMYSEEEMAEAWVEGYHRKVDELNGDGNLTSFNEWLKQLNNKKK